MFGFSKRRKLLIEICFHLVVYMRFQIYIFFGVKYCPYRYICKELYDYAWIPISEFNKEIVKNKGMALTLQQFKSMIIKKAIHSWRNRIVTFVQLLLPVIFTILALVIEANAREFAEEPALNLNQAKFENPVALYDNPANPIAAKYKDLFTTKEDTSAASSFDRYIIDKMKQVGLITTDA